MQMLILSPVSSASPYFVATVSLTVTPPSLIIACNRERD